MTQSAWRSWYHCTVGTYAQWLPGDPRGWRERNHHEHIEGDYKRPPIPSNFADGRHKHSQRITRGEPYLIPSTEREPIGRLLLNSFNHQQIPLLALAVTINNFHALIQCHDHQPKQIIGQAKRHATFQFAAITNTASHKRQQLWETGGAAKPIRDRAHAVNAFNYILDHIKEGAWVWSYKTDPQKPAVSDGAGRSPSIAQKSFGEKNTP